MKNNLYLKIAILFYCVLFGLWGIAFGRQIGVEQTLNNYTCVKK